jgi:hypothetical protein
MATPLSPPQHQNPRRDRQQELAALNDQFDLATGKKSKPTPWHTEKGLYKTTKQALDSLEPQKKPGGFYQEDPKMAARQDAFDAAVKNIPAQGAGTYKLGPVTPEERLRSWHKSLGTPSHIVEKEVADLKEQEGKA